MLDKLLQLEPQSSQVFVAHNHQKNFREKLFGGQVLAQGLMAAGQTTSRPIHSLHAYFLKPGSPESPVTYQVNTLRNGKSVVSREVDAVQDGEIILSMLCSFHKEEQGYEHQFPETPSCPEADEIYNKMSSEQKATLKKISDVTLNDAPIEFVPSDMNVFASSPQPHAKGAFWFRTTGFTPKSTLESACALAFCSDIGILSTALLPHKGNLFDGGIIPATMNHSIWFHHPICPQNWLLYSAASPWAGNARAFCLGTITDTDGVLVASTAQEGLIRPNQRQN